MTIESYAPGRSTQDAGSMTDLSGRKAFVTGGSRGLGRGAAMELARAGADVAIVYRRDQASADAVVAEIDAIGRGAVAYQADVSDYAQIEAAANAARSALGGLDIVVAAAGQGSPWLSLAETPPEKWRRLLSSNLDGLFFTGRATIPGLIEQGHGSVIFFTSPGGDRGCFMQGPYAAAKAAASNLTATWALEVAGKGVRVNAVSPGLFETDMTAAIRKGELPAIPAGRIGQPPELGQIITFLCSDAADYINGTVIRVDGAWFA